MQNFRQSSSRHLSTTSLNLGVASVGSTPAFGTQTYQIRVMSDVRTQYVINDAAAVSSTTILTTGAVLPPNTIEHVTVSPGQRLSTVSSVSSVTVWVTETA